MRRTRPLRLAIASLAGLMLSGGCFARIENGLDLVLGIGSQSAAQVAPYLSVAAPALFFGRLLNLGR